MTSKSRRWFLKSSSGVIASITTQAKAVGRKTAEVTTAWGLQKVQLKKPIELAGVTIEGIVNTYTTSAGAAPGFLRGLMANETVSLTVRKEEGGIPVLKEQLIDDIVTDSDLTEKEVRDGLNALNNMDGEPTVTVKYRE